MFFTLSKIVYALAQPSSLLVLAVLAGLLLAMGTAWRRLGHGLSLAALSLLVLCGVLPVGNLLLSPLEERFPQVPAEAIGGRAAGIILLGGFEDGWVSAGRGGLAVNEAAERLTEGARLARRIDGVPVVFTGGAGILLTRGRDAAGPVADYLADMGIARERIVLESRARNTHENALLTRDLVKPEPGKPWVLVTSAYHMPRSVGIFRRAGFEVIAYPVDFRTRGPDDLWRLFDRIPSGLERLDVAAKEWLGLIAYRLSGRTDALFPAP